MNYNVGEILKGNGTRVIFVSDPQDSTEIENAVYASDTRYKHEINKAFASVKKVGPFKLKNKTSIWNILKNAKKIKEEGLEFLSLQLKNIDLHGYMDRYPRTLSYQQRIRASVLYEVMNENRSCLLLNDCYSPFNGELVLNKGKQSFFTVESFFRKYDRFEWVPYDFIWITDMPMNEFFEQMGDKAFSSDCYKYYIAENGNITLQDTNKLKQSIDSAKPKEEPVKSEQPRYTLEEFRQAFEKVDIKFDEEEPEPDITPYMSVIRVFHGDLGTMIVAHMITGKISVQDKLKNDRTGKIYKTTNFRYINSIQNFDETADDYYAYLDEVDASKDSRMFVFFIDVSCDIEEWDSLSKA